MMSPVIRVSDKTYERLKQWADAWETQDETVRRVLNRAGVPASTPRETPRRHQHDLSSVDEYVELMTDAARSVWTKLQSRLSEVGEDIEVGVTPQYIKLVVSGRNFAEVSRRRLGLLVTVHPEGHDFAPGTRAVEDGLALRRAAETTGWTLDVSAEVNPDSDLDAAVRLLRRSYEAVKRRRGG
jgi:hypothetical protein